MCTALNTFILKLDLFTIVCVRAGALWIGYGDRLTLANLYEPRNHFELLNSAL